MTKYRRLREALLAQRVLDESDLVVPDPAEWDDIRLAHCASYVEAVANGTLTAEAQRRIGFPWSPGMVERSRRSVGATIAAARHVMASGERVSANLAGGATTHCDRGAGCVTNDGHRGARATGWPHQARLVDCDVHQGDGTAAIFRDDRIFTDVLHATNFPFARRPATWTSPFQTVRATTSALAALAMHLRRCLAALSRWCSTSPELTLRGRPARQAVADRRRARSAGPVRFEQCRIRSIPVGQPWPALLSRCRGHCRHTRTPSRKPQGREMPLIDPGKKALRSP